MVRGVQRYTWMICLMLSIRHTGNMPRPMRSVLVALRCRFALRRVAVGGVVFFCMCGVGGVMLCSWGCRVCDVDGVGGVGGS